MSLKPLVMWARDQFPQPYKLRYTTKNQIEVRGLVKIQDQWVPFVYDRQHRVITLGEGENARTIRINQWGWEEDGGPFFLSPS